MVAPALIAAGIGAGVGLLQQTEQEQQFRRAAELAAARTELSPFNPEIGPGRVGAAPSLFQNVLTGALSGAGVVGKNPSAFGQKEEKDKVKVDEGAQLTETPPEATVAEAPPVETATAQSKFAQPKRTVIAPPLEEQVSGSNFGGSTGRRPI